MLTEKRLHNILNKFYKEHYGDRDTDEYYVNPKPNIWKFKRDGKIITLTYNADTNKVEVTEKKI